MVREMYILAQFMHTIERTQSESVLEAFGGSLEAFLSDLDLLDVVMVLCAPHIGRRNERVAVCILFELEQMKVPASAPMRHVLHMEKPRNARPNEYADKVPLENHPKHIAPARLEPRQRKQSNLSARHIDAEALPKHRM